MTYGTAQIAHALGVSPRRLTSAVERGFLSAQRGLGSGNHRTFTKADVLQFALFEALCGFGISKARAATIAAEHYADNGLLILDGQHQALNAARERCNIPPTALLVDLDRLRAEIDE